MSSIKSSFPGGRNWDKSGILTDRTGRAVINSSPSRLKVLHLLQLCAGRASEQQRQRALHPAHVLQKLSQGCSSTTSRDSQGTPRESSKEPASATAGHALTRTPAKP